MFAYAVCVYTLITWSCIQKMGEEGKTAGGGVFLLILPVFGRIFGWW